jgi:hypothetical protein
MNRLAAAHRIALYTAFLVLLATGGMWEVADPGPYALLLMKIHGAAAMLALVLIGTLLAYHVPAGWKVAKNRQSGTLLLAAFTWLAASGYVLYYAAGESLRYYASQSHLWLGIAACAIVALHVRRSELP